MSHGQAFSQSEQMAGIQYNIMIDELQKEIRDTKIGDKVYRKAMRKLIRDELKTARKAISGDARKATGQDPRAAYKAVKMAVYRKLLGGNVSIMEPKGVKYVKAWAKKRTLRPGQVGGNRMGRSQRTEQVDSYYGQSRAFILRFLNSGTKGRLTNTKAYRNTEKKYRRRRLDKTKGVAYRGRIAGKGWFEESGNRHMESAAVRIAENVAKKVVNDFNGEKKE